MIDQVQELLDQYWAWLKDKTKLREVGGEWVEITTPHLDRHNDYLQIYSRRQNGTLVLTDDGYIIGDLNRSGCRLDSPKRQALLNMTLAGFGVQLVDGRLEVHASAENFAMRKHNLLQAMLAVNDLFYLAKPIVESLFYEDVVAWLDANDIRYTPSVKFTGISGYDHHFHFAIPKSKKQPERIVQAITRPTRDNALLFINACGDTRQVRAPESTAYAVLNDEQPIPGAVLEAFRNYDIRPVPWTERIDVVTELAA